MSELEEVAKLLVRRCINCYTELPGYNAHGEGWNWLTPNVGPFCSTCWTEILQQVGHKSPELVQP